MSEKTAAELATIKAAEPTPTVLIVKADTACQLTVNGENKGVLQANKARTVKVSPGEQLIECIGENPGARAQQTRGVYAGMQAVVVLAIAEKISDQPQAPSPARVAAASDASNSAFADMGRGVLRNNRSGLEWTQADNGADIDWDGARKYCAALSGGWRLPSEDELTAIYDAGVPSPKVCAVSGTVSYACKTSPLFQLTSGAFWSATQDGSRAWQMNLFSGQRDRIPVDYAHAARALCVRHP